MIITTSLSIEGRSITTYLGIVSAAQIMAMPGGDKAVQRGWQSAVEGATAILEKQAFNLGADAIIAVRIEPFGNTICATGTAVKLN